MTKRVVMFSAGVGSWAAARRVVDKHGVADVILLFCDTLIEDPDTYRFLTEGAKNVGGELICISDGRDPWEVFFDERMLGNSQKDPCSKILKRRLARKWLQQNCNPASTVVYYGIDWTESHRIETIRKRLGAWAIEAPLCEAPWQTKQDLLRDLDAYQIKRPKLYNLGFPHGNCGGFCIKAGHAQFALLLRVNRPRYLYHEGREQEFIAFIGKDVSILKDRRGGKTKPLTLRDFRLRIEGGADYDQFDWGGCGCFA